jgi:hypothetical protein
MLPATGRQHRGCIKPQAVTRSLVLLKMGKITARNMLSWLELLLLLHLVGCLNCLYQWCTVKQISDNEIYLLIKYIKSILWVVAKRLSYIEDARCLKVKVNSLFHASSTLTQVQAPIPIWLNSQSKPYTGTTIKLSYFPHCNQYTKWAWVV